MIPAALDQLGPEDMCSSRCRSTRGAARRAHPMRPEAFSPRAVCSDQACVDGRGLGFDGMTGMVGVVRRHGAGRMLSRGPRRHGRGGVRRPRPQRSCVGVLDSLEFDPRDAPVAYPVPRTLGVRLRPAGGQGLTDLAALRSRPRCRRSLPVRGRPLRFGLHHGLRRQLLGGRSFATRWAPDRRAR